MKHRFVIFDWDGTLALANNFGCTEISVPNENSDRRKRLGTRGLTKKTTSIFRLNSMLFQLQVQEVVAFRDHLLGNYHADCKQIFLFYMVL